MDVHFYEAEYWRREASILKKKLEWSNRKLDAIADYVRTRLPLVTHDESEAILTSIESFICGDCEIGDDSDCEKEVASSTPGLVRQRSEQSLTKKWTPDKVLKPKKVVKKVDTTMAKNDTDNKKGVISKSSSPLVLYTALPPQPLQVAAPAPSLSCDGISNDSLKSSSFLSSLSSPIITPEKADYRLLPSITPSIPDSSSSLSTSNVSSISSDSSGSPGLSPADELIVETFLKSLLSAQERRANHRTEDPEACELLRLVEILESNMKAADSKEQVEKIMVFIAKAKFNTKIKNWIICLAIGAFASTTLYQLTDDEQCAIISRGFGEQRKIQTIRIDKGVFTFIQKQTLCVYVDSKGALTLVKGNINKYLRLYPDKASQWKATPSPEKVNFGWMLQRIL